MDAVVRRDGIRSLRALWSFRSPRIRPLATQILLLQVAVVAASIVAAGLLSFWLVREQIVAQYQDRALALARVVAATPDVVEAYDDADPSLRIQPLAEAIRRSAGASFVVVTDQAGIRYSHPNPARIGERVSTDPSAALAGDDFVGVQRGTLGVSVRAKVPVRDRDGGVIGMVSLGFLEDELASDLLAAMPWIGGSVLLALGFGLAGSFALARRLRSQTFDLGPGEIAALLEEHQELDNVRRLTNTLRAQTHEFANKLHTIAGLIELGRHQEAVRFITETAMVQEELIAVIQTRVADPVVAALLIAKAAVASERGVDLRIAEDTALSAASADAKDLVTVIGNLVDNGIDAAAPERGWVEVSVQESASAVDIRVRDSGPGIDPALASEIFSEGKTSKQGHYGVGLALVDRIARKRGGWVRATNDAGAVFTVSLPRAPVAV